MLAVLALLRAELKERKELMTVSVVGLSIDCADAAALARFWSEVLGRPVNPGADAGHAAIDVTDPCERAPAFVPEGP